MQLSNIQIIELLVSGYLSGYANALERAKSWSGDAEFTKSIEEIVDDAKQLAEKHLSSALIKKEEK
jgi:hypothetical protein